MEIEDKLIKFGLVLYCFSAALSIAGANIGLGITFIAFVIKMIRKREIKFKSTGLEFPIAIYLVINIFSTIFSEDFLLSLSFLGEKIILLILIYYLVFNSIKDLEFIKKLIITLVVSVVIASSYGIYQHYFLNIYRASGFVGVLPYASILILVLPLLINLSLMKLIMKKKFIMLLSTIMAILSLVFTNTRGAWIGIIGGVTFLGLFKDKRVIEGLVIVIILFLLFMPSFYERVTTIGDLKDTSNYERLLMWKSSFNMFKDYPLLGVGPGMFSELYLVKYILPEAKFKVRHYAHSIVMNMLAETGVLGLSSFVLFIFFIFKNGFNLIYKLNDKYWSNVVLGLLSGIVAFLIHGLTFYNLGDSESAKLFWFVIALIMVVNRELVDNKEKVLEEG